MEFLWALCVENKFKSGTDEVMIGVCDRFKVWWWSLLKIPWRRERVREKYGGKGKVYPHDSVSICTVCAQARPGCAER